MQSGIADPASEVGGDVPIAAFADEPSATPNAGTGRARPPEIVILRYAQNTKAKGPASAGPSSLKT